MTLFELLTGAAVTRVVAAELRFARVRRRRVVVAIRAHVAAARRRGPVPRSRRLLRGRALLLLVLLRLRGGPDRDAKGRLRDAGRDSRLHLLEVIVRLALVGDEWILLAVPAQID